MYKKIIITGGTGFIGISFCKFLNEKIKNHEIILFDKNKNNFDKKIFKKSKNKISFIQGHTKNFDKFFKNIKNIDTIFHFGEFSRIAVSFEDIDKCFESNGLGTFKVINFCRLNKIKLVYSASSSRFGNNGKDEHLSPYSWTKSKNLELIRNFNKWFGLKYEIVYFYNVYGAGHYRYNKMAAVIGIFEGQYLKNKPLTIVGSGNQSRDFTHISDIVTGTYLAWKKNLNKEYMLGTNKNHKIIDIAKMFKHKIKHLPNRKGERFSSNKINHKSQNILGYRAKIKIQDYIKKFLYENKKKN